MQSALSDKLRAPQIPGFWSGRAPGGKDKLMHLSKGLAYSLRPKRILDVLPMCLVLVRECIKPTPNDAVPDGAKAAVRPDGLCGIAHDLEPDRLKQAYSRGVFPWNHIGPVKWWAPRERALLFFDEFKVDKNARRKLRNDRFRFTMDRAFLSVMKACAQPRPGTVGLTWINQRIITAYTKAHIAGDAHSIEVWDEDGQLVGGVYGYVFGRVFFTESQFYRARDASKAGFAVLNRHLQHWGFVVNDGKHQTPHLGSMGFAPQPRETLNEIIAHYGEEVTNSHRVWTIIPELCSGDWEPANSVGRTREEVLSAITDLKKGYAA